MGTDGRRAMTEAFRQQQRRRRARFSDGPKRRRLPVGLEGIDDRSHFTCARIVATRSGRCVIIFLFRFSFHIADAPRRVELTVLARVH